jgi:hypothetical protein
MNKIKFIFLVLPVLLVLGCSDNTTDPGNTNKTVKYYANISPSDPNVLKTITYTNANGVDAQESVASFQRTITFAKGSVVNLSASGSISSILDIRVIVEIWIDDVLVARDERNGPGNASASVTATVP